MSISMPTTKTMTIARRSGGRQILGLMTGTFLCFWCCLACVMKASASNGVATNYLAYASVSWSGGAACSSCSSGNYTSSFACSSSVKGWNEGVKFFMDPTPIGSKITKVTLHVYGTYGCDVDDTTPAKINIELQQYQVSTLILPVTSCTCGNCVTMVQLERSTPNGWPAYNSSGLNELQVILYSNEICLSYIDVILQYSFSPTMVTNLEPNCGPSIGSTIVQVLGASFVDFTPLCHFGNVTAPAEYISSTELQCLSPPHSAADVNFTVSYPKAVNRSEVHGSAIFRFYQDVKLTKVIPDTDHITGGTNLTLYGENIINTEPLIRCKFASQNYTVLVVGSFNLEGEVVCTSPQWNDEEITNLSLSLNAQQFSLPLQFTYDSEPSKGKLVWLVLGFSCLALFCIIFLSFLLYRRRVKKARHDKLTANEELDLKDIQLGNVIGTGTFGHVYKAKWKGVTVAIKKLPSHCLSHEFMREFRKEVSIMRALTHPNVLQFFGCCMDPPDICLAMEFMCRGSLFSILHNPQLPMNLSLALRLLVDAAKGCLYLHSCTPAIIHRDLKSHNLLVDEHWKVKVCDFGLSAIIANASQTLTACGTPSWTAPEVLRRMHYTVKVDVYSFGIVMFECVTRQDPYDGMTPYTVIFGVANEGLRPTLPTEVPAPYAKLTRECWAEDPDMRPDFSVILHNLERLKSLCHNTPPVCRAHQELHPLNSPIAPSISTTAGLENFTFARKVTTTGRAVLDVTESSDIDVNDDSSSTQEGPEMDSILLH
ncbi:protein kinase [Pelomyxa schiedti]|nr:protein kinase [Pelomyxa schiedti]